jgi:hypothetical protein
MSQEKQGLGKLSKTLGNDEELADVKLWMLMSNYVQYMKSMIL